LTEDAPANPRGIFDRTTRGTEVGPVSALVERGAIRFFAHVLGATDPIHFDVEAARAAGHADLVAPPSFFMYVESVAGGEFVRRGLQTASQLVKFDFRYLLHGDERYTYAAPIYAGEEVQFTMRVVDFYDKKGGAMEFVSLEAEIRHAERGVLVRASRTLLHRLPACMP
jgi:acyl dehydratase